MSEKIKFNFLEFSGSEEGEGRNGYSLDVTPGLLNDTDLVTEYVKYAVGNGRQLSVKRGPDIIPLLTAEELDVYASAASQAKFDVARQIALGLNKYHKQNPIESIRIEYPSTTLPEKK